MTRAENLEMGIAAAIAYANAGRSMGEVVGKLQDSLDAPCEETPLEQALERAERAEMDLMAVIVQWKRLADAMDVALMAKGAQR